MSEKKYNFKNLDAYIDGDDSSPSPPLHSSPSPPPLPLPPTPSPSPSPMPMRTADPYATKELGDDNSDDNDDGGYGVGRPHTDIHYTNAVYSTLSVYRLTVAMVSLGLTVLICFLALFFSRVSSDGQKMQQSMLTKPGIYELFAIFFGFVSVLASLAFLRTNQRRIGNGASFFSLLSKQ